MHQLVAGLRSKLETVKKGGGEAAVKRHKEHGKMFVRERIHTVLDHDTPFLEFSALRPAACTTMTRRRPDW